MKFSISRHVHRPSSSFGILFLCIINTQNATGTTRSQQCHRTACGLVCRSCCERRGAWRRFLQWAIWKGYISLLYEGSAAIFRMAELWWYTIKVSGFQPTVIFKIWRQENGPISTWSFPINWFRVSVHINSQGLLHRDEGWLESQGVCSQPSEKLPVQLDAHPKTCKCFV